MLIQEELRSEPWKMLVACVLLNQTNIRQVRRVLPELFSRWPTAADLSEADAMELASIIRHCGLQNRRAATLKRMCAGMLVDGWESDPGSLHGVGKYALDSWMIFQLGRFDVQPTDKELIRYLHERQAGDVLREG